MEATPLLPSANLKVLYDRAVAGLEELIDMGASQEIIDAALQPIEALAITCGMLLAVQECYPLLLKELDAESNPKALRFGDMLNTVVVE
jgi:hypothetical protein